MKNLHVNNKNKTKRSGNNKQVNELEITRASCHTEWHPSSILALPSVERIPPLQVNHRRRTRPTSGRRHATKTQQHVLLDDRSRLRHGCQLELLVGLECRLVVH